MASYLAVKTRLKGYLFEIESSKGVSEALGKKGGAPFAIYESKSDALRFLEATGLPIEIASTKIKAPTLVACLASPLSKKGKVMPK
jgi:hypothetical protein